MLVLEILLFALELLSKPFYQALEGVETHGNTFYFTKLIHLFMQLFISLLWAENTCLSDLSRTRECPSSIPVSTMAGYFLALKGSTDSVHSWSETRPDHWILFELQPAQALSWATLRHAGQSPLEIAKSQNQELTAGALRKRKTSRIISNRTL